MMTELATRLRELRKTAKLSQRVAAKEVGVSVSSWSMYEIGEREPGIETLKKIAGLFSVTIDDLVNNKVIETQISEIAPKLTALSPEDYQSTIATIRRSLQSGFRVAIVEPDEELQIETPELDMLLSAIDEWGNRLDDIDNICGNTIRQIKQGTLDMPEVALTLLRKRAKTHGLTITQYAGCIVLAVNGVANSN